MGQEHAQRSPGDPSVLTYCNSGVRVGRLHQFFALVSDHPVWIDLSCSLGVQMDHLELSEVSDADGVVLWAHVEDVRDVVIVKVVFAGVTSAVTCLLQWHRNICRC